MIGFIDIRFNEINFYVVFFTLFIKFEKISFLNYVKNYIFLSKCRIVITGTDNHIAFYKLKKFFPEKKFISIQNGFRNKNFFDILRKEKNLKADYIFGFNKSFCKLYKKYISTKTISLGSFRNNSFKTNKINKKKSILFISMGGPLALPIVKYNTFRFDTYKFHKNDLKLLKIVSDFCTKKIALSVFSKYHGNKGFKEIQYWKENIKNKKIKYSVRKSPNNKDMRKEIYNLSDKNLITISTHSTLV